MDQRVMHLKQRKNVQIYGCYTYMYLILVFVYEGNEGF